MDNTCGQPSTDPERNNLMTWFKVDDSFDSHPKAEAASLAALGLWTIAGAWCGRHLTDGNVPDHVIPRLSRGAGELADELVSAGLWRRTRSGYRFHQWSERNPTRGEATAAREKKSSGGTLGNHRRWHLGRGVPDVDCRYCQEKLDRYPDRSTDRGTDRVRDRLANPPDPARPEEQNNPSPKTGGGYDDDPAFGEFWDAYPLKKAKAAAFKAWRAALKRRHDPALITVAAKRYRDDPKRKPDYTAHPATWLNAERYNDAEPETVPQQIAGGWWNN